jgi:hypothetical protein
VAAAAVVVAIGAALTVAQPASHSRSARTQLAKLPTITGAAPGYVRALFGGWADPDGDGCDTRAEVLIRDLDAERVDPHSCRVLSGVLSDPYTGRTGPVTASQVDVDHLVALQDAWLSGAAAWTVAQRHAYANDPTNLVATAAAVNRGKGGHGPDQWQPPGGQGAQCAYATRYVGAKTHWHLGVTVGQRTALERMLDQC